MLLPNPAGKGGAIQLVRQIKSLLFALEVSGQLDDKPVHQVGAPLFQLLPEKMPGEIWVFDKVRVLGGEDEPNQGFPGLD